MVCMSNRAEKEKTIGLRKTELTIGLGDDVHSSQSVPQLLTMKPLKSSQSNQSMIKTNMSAYLSPKIKSLRNTTD